MYIIFPPKKLSGHVLIEKILQEIDFIKYFIKTAKIN